MNILRKLFNSEKKTAPAKTDFKQMSASALTNVLQEALSLTAASQKPIDEMNQLLREGEGALKFRENRGLRPIEQRLLEWIQFLMKAGNLEAHVKLVSGITETLTVKSRFPRESIHVLVFPIPGIFSYCRSGSQIDLKLHESLITMTTEERQTFATALCSRNRNHASQLARSIYFRPAARAIQALFTDTPKKSLQKASARGKVYDLEQLFDQVNEQHFHNRLGKPTLKWSTSKNKSRFGSYNFRTDAIILNKVLDSEKVPKTVVAYVLYHELLHKALGYKTKSGRVRTHTTEFRNAEKAFPDSDAIEKFLSGMHLS